MEDVGPKKWLKKQKMAIVLQTRRGVSSVRVKTDRG